MLFILPFSPELSKNQRSFPKISRSRQGNLFASITKKTSYSDEQEAQIWELRKQLKEHYPEFRPKQNAKYILNVLCVVTDRRSDSHNLIDATMDILQEVLGSNDKNFYIESWVPFYKPRRKLSKIEKALDLDKIKGRVFIRIKEADESYEQSMLSRFQEELESVNDLVRFNQKFSEV